MSGGNEDEDADTEGPCQSAQGSCWPLGSGPGTYWSLHQWCWLGAESRAKHWGAPTCQHSLGIREERGWKAEPGWRSSRRRWRDRWRDRWEPSRKRDGMRMWKRALGTMPRRSAFNFAKEKAALRPPAPGQSSCSLFLWLPLGAPRTQSTGRRACGTGRLGFIHRKRTPWEEAVFPEARFSVQRTRVRPRSWILVLPAHALRPGNEPAGMVCR